MVGALQVSRALADRRLADASSSRASRPHSRGWAPSIKADTAALLAVSRLGTARRQLRPVAEVHSRPHRWPRRPFGLSTPVAGVPSRGSSEAASSSFGPVCIRRRVWCILNRMVQYASSRLDASFSALSDGTRRGVLEQLGRADASITALAETFHMTLTGMRKHVRVLERAGLVTTAKAGRVRTCKLGPRRLEEETVWIGMYRQLWDERFDELDKVVEELERKEKVNGRKKTE
jgi:DNA-binding transcriptional ArsR family regulator